MGGGTRAVERGGSLQILRGHRISPGPEMVALMGLNIRTNGQVNFKLYLAA